MQVGGVKAKLMVDDGPDPAPVAERRGADEAAATYEHGASHGLGGSMPAAASREAHGPAAIQALNGASPDFMRGAQERIVALGAAQFSPAAQKNLITYLEEHTHLPEDAGQLTWVAGKVWQLTRGASFDLSLLKEFYRAHGMRVAPNDGLPAGHPGYQIDRVAFRDTLRRIEEAGGTLDRRGALALIESLKSVVDADDLAWCSGEIHNRIKTGRLRVADAKSSERLDAFFTGKLAGQLGYAEIGLEMRWLRQSGFAPHRLAAVRRLLAERVADEQALFAAERAFTREVNKARRQAQGDTAVLARIEATQAELSAFFASRLAGRFDSYKTEKRLVAMHRKGQIDERTLLAYRAAAVTSTTREEFAYGVMSAGVALALAQFQAQLVDLWSDVYQNISRNLSDDLCDAEGRIIESASERQYKRVLAARELERIQLEPAKTQQLATRAFLRAHRQSTLSALLGEKDPSRRAGFESALARADIELVDLEPPRTAKT